MALNPQRYIIHGDTAATELLSIVTEERDELKEERDYLLNKIKKLKKRCKHYRLKNLLKKKERDSETRWAKHYFDMWQKEINANQSTQCNEEPKTPTGEKFTTWFDNCIGKQCTEEMHKTIKEHILWLSKLNNLAFYEAREAKIQSETDRAERNTLIVENAELKKKLNSNSDPDEPKHIAFGAGTNDFG